MSRGESPMRGLRNSSRLVLESNETTRLHTFSARETKITRHICEKREKFRKSLQKNGIFEKKMMTKDKKCVII